MAAPDVLCIDGCQLAPDLCLKVNPERAGGAYGYVDTGGRIASQAEYFMVPYADFNLLKFPDKAQALQKMRDLTCITDILPTGFHGAVNAKLGVGSTVYIAGAGPVGSCCCRVAPYSRCGCRTDRRRE